MKGWGPRSRHPTAVGRADGAEFSLNVHVPRIHPHLKPVLGPPDHAAIQKQEEFVVVIGEGTAEHGRKREDEPPALGAQHGKHCMIKLCAVRGDDHGLDAVEDVGAAGLYDTECTPDRINIVTEVSRVCVCERESVCESE